jgi:exoribonuclease II
MMDPEKHSGRPLDKAVKAYEQSWFVQSFDSVSDWLRSSASEYWPPQGEDDVDSLQYLANFGTAMHQAFDLLFGKKVI